MSPLASDLFAMFQPVRPTQAELHEALHDAPFPFLEDSDIDGLCHSFSGRPVHLPTVSPKLVADELAQLEGARKRENRGSPHEF